MIIVVRYFGGIKLGASGLASAYKSAARQVLNECLVITQLVTEEIIIQSDHQHMGILMSGAKNIGFTIVRIEYVPTPQLTLSAPLKDLQSNLNRLKAKTLNITLEEARITKTTDVFHILDEK